MALGSQRGLFRLPTVLNGTVTLTFPFELKLLLLTGNQASFALTGSTVQSIDNADNRLVIGVATGVASRRYIAYQVDQGADTMNTDRGHGDDGCYGTISTAGAFDGRLDVDSWTYDSGDNETTVVLIADDAFPIASDVFYWGIGGPGVDAAITTQTEPGATGVTAFNVGLTDAECFLLLTAGINAAPPGVATGAQWSFGVCDKDGNQWVSAMGSQNGIATASAYRYARTDQCLVMFPGAVTTLDCRASWSSYSGSNLSLNFAERASTRRFFVVAIKGVSAQAASLQFASGSGTAQTTAAPFPVIAGFGSIGFASPQANDTPSSNAVFALGTFAQGNTDGHQHGGHWSCREIIAAQAAPFGLYNERGGFLSVLATTAGNRDGLMTSAHSGSQVEVTPSDTFSSATTVQLLLLGSKASAARAVAGSVG